MRITKPLAVAAAGLSLAAAAGLPALAAGSHPAHPATGKNGTFASKLSPKSGVHSGTVMTLKSSKAHKNVQYTCVLAAVEGKKNAPNLSNTTTATSNAKGKFHCSLTFHPFSGTIKGHTVHCPQTKKDKKRGVKCGFAAADALHSQTDNTIQYFSSHK